MTGTTEVLLSIFQALLLYEDTIEEAISNGMQSHVFIFLAIFHNEQEIRLICRAFA